jgi:hypothetical protein
MHSRNLVVIAALAALSGCNGSGSGSSTAAATAAPAATTVATPTTATTAVPAAAPAAPVGTASTWVYPKAIAGAAATTTAASTTATSTATPGAPVSTGTASSATAPAGLATGGSTGAATTGVVLSGTVPPSPTVGFTGLLFLIGERIVPGSSVVVGFGGTTVGVFPGIFTSSQVLGVDLSIVVAGDYTFTALAPDGTTSNPTAVTVAAASTTASFTLQTPAIQMVFPPSFDPSFVGTVWIMGDNFLPGCTLVGTDPNGTAFAAPLTYMNNNTLGWETATPISGNYSLEVLDPTFQTSTAVTITVSGAAAAATGGPAPNLTYPPTSVASPFFGTARIFGTSFVAGATLELTDASGNMTSTSLVFISSDEVWWMLVYPAVGSYTALVRNPDGQATPSWPFVVTP